MKLRFLIYHHRKNSVKDKVIGKKWICSDSERNTLYRQCGPSRRVSVPTKSGVVSSYRLGNFIANGWENYSNFGKEWRFPEFGPLPTPWSFNSVLEMSWHLWVCRSVQSLSRIRLFATPWTAARQAALSITHSQGEK